MARQKKVQKTAKLFRIRPDVIARFEHVCECEVRERSEVVERLMDRWAKSRMAEMEKGNQTDVFNVGL